MASRGVRVNGVVSRAEIRTDGSVELIIHGDVVDMTIVVKDGHVHRVRDGLTSVMVASRTKTAEIYMPSEFVEAVSV